MAEGPDTEISLVEGRLLVRFRSAALGDATEVELRLGGSAVGRTRPGAVDAGWSQVSFAVPDAALTDGAALLDVHLMPSGAHLGRYTLFCGSALPDDVATTLALLQAEVQTLKQAFMADGAVPKLTAAERPLLVAEAVEQVLAELDHREMRKRAPVKG